MEFELARVFRHEDLNSKCGQNRCPHRGTTKLFGQECLAPFIAELLGRIFPQSLAQSATNWYSTPCRIIQSP